MMELKSAEAGAITQAGGTAFAPPADEIVRAGPTGGERQSMLS